MPRTLAYLGQIVVYALIAVCLGVFAQAPSYRHFPEDKAQVTLSLSHIGQRLGDCRKLTPEEIAEMAANMRRAELCPRERHPIFVELLSSGKVLFSALAQPTGLAGDGASHVHERFEIAPGRQQFVARLRDSGLDQGFDYARSAELVLAPGQNFVIDFRAAMGGFVFSTDEVGAAEPRSE